MRELIEALMASMSSDYTSPRQAELVVAIRKELMSGQWKPGTLPGTLMEDIKDREPDCLVKAQSRGQLTFTLVEQDYSSPSVICEWIKINIETCPREKLFEALDKAIRIRDTKVPRKDPD